ncbi:hypothetical protein CMK11_02985 [Candidatus Poribacteria bacterium]|nr:hypothetical protein [Candidatus Poribacteria bacterium]
MPMDTVKVAAAQLLTGEDVEANAEGALALLERAAEDGAKLVAFPEGCLFGYTCRTDYWDAMDPARLAAAEGRIAEECRRLGVAVVIGSAQRVDGNWYNDLAIFDETGALKYRYAKTFLAGEPWCLNNRGRLPIVRLAGVDCCFIICHDVRYPELVRLPAAAGGSVVHLLLLRVRADGGIQAVGVSRDAHLAGDGERHLPPDGEHPGEPGRPPLARLVARELEGRAS